jgi:hypothetical protein
VLTFPQDWVLFKAEERITAYLQDIGCQRVIDLFGIKQFDLSAFTREEAEDNSGDFSVSITGSALCERTGQTLLNITGTRYSYERFITDRKLRTLQIEPEVRKAARANLDGNMVRELAGLKSVPVEELDAVWAAAGQKWKNHALCPKGRGFGSQAERQGATVQQSEIEPQFQPRCGTCNEVMRFVSAGKNQQGKPYAAFWSCSSRQHQYTLPHAQAIKEAAEARKDAAREQHKNGVNDHEDPSA